MPFEEGNRLWERRSSHGRSPIFETPDELWGACVEYFEWNDENPLFEAKAFSFQGMVTVEELPKMRAMTIAALCIFLDISRSTWDNYRERDDFLGVVTRVEGIIFEQKFAGAAADLLNANIIARDLGLADKKDLSSSDGTMTPTVIERRVVKPDGDS